MDSDLQRCISLEKIKTNSENGACKYEKHLERKRKTREGRVGHKITDIMKRDGYTEKKKTKKERVTKEAI
jgi:hypothetical protein